MDLALMHKAKPKPTIPPLRSPTCRLIFLDSSMDGYYHKKHPKAIHLRLSTSNGLDCFVRLVDGRGYLGFRVGSK
jgi:hypothetical protein